MHHYVTECKVTSSWDIEPFPITAGLWICGISSELSLVPTGTGMGVRVPKVDPASTSLNLLPALAKDTAN